MYMLPDTNGNERVMPQSTDPRKVTRQAVDEGNLHATQLVNLVLKTYSDKKF